MEEEREKRHGYDRATESGGGYGRDGCGSKMTVEVRMKPFDNSSPRIYIGVTSTVDARGSKRYICPTHVGLLCLPRGFLRRSSGAMNH